MSIENAHLEHKEGRKRKDWTFIRYKVANIWEINSGADGAKSFFIRGERSIKCNLSQGLVIKKLESFISSTFVCEEHVIE